MIFEGLAQVIGNLLATDGALMVLSMMFGILLGMLWSGRSFPRRLPRSMTQASAVNFRRLL
ncbi:hypothetical protein [Sandarakinorhabdus sp. AAP62]|uniref:hypothetical protein n=1 Tax=Sandarakinorhabdus sp. AAP62 TaxID=1248916 RepID=UPI0002E3376A|nr:hypothetical protein [Sandarakinorhabdus sp. AAP62]